MRYKSRAEPSKPRPRRVYRALGIERLTCRIEFAVITVTTVVDIVDDIDGLISLREATTQANAENDLDTIQFAPELFIEGPATIQLVNGQINIDSALELKGPGPDLLTVDGKNLSRVFEIGDGTFDVKITDMFITGGATFGDDDFLVNENDGPAVLAMNSGVTEFDRVVVSQNYTHGSYAHGAISAVAGNLIVRNSVLKENSTSGYRSFGGAIYVFNHNVRIENSQLNNNASLGQEGGGGAVAAEYGTIDAIDSTFTENVVGGYAAFGGALSGGDTTLTRSVVSDNRTEGAYGRGGGVAAEKLTLVDSEVNKNETLGDFANGGGIWCGSDLTVTRSGVTENSTRGGGGGIAFDGYIKHGSLTIEESKISGNVASHNSEVWFTSNYGPDFDIDLILVGTQQLTFGDVDKWRLGQPLDREGKFLLTASQVDSAMSRLLIETAYPFTNPLSPSDVNNSGSVTAVDALLVLNEIARRNRSGSQSAMLELPTVEGWRGRYVDQNQDGKVTPLDALRVLNEISRALRAKSSPSGEASSTKNSTRLIMDKDKTTLDMLGDNNSVKLSSLTSSPRILPVQSFNGFKGWMVKAEEISNDGPISTLDEQSDLQQRLRQTL